MKIRLRTVARGATQRRCFVLHPLSFAICMAMSGAALALPQGGKVVAGDATIGTPSPHTEVIKQTSDKAIIDWQSFSIAAGERVRFYQPSSTSITLNRVVGYDPSKILGQMSSNGKIFLINPHGVIFGAGARIDVGGLVVSSLSMSDNDFLAGRYSLTSVDASAPAERGEVRNDGTINAPGGLVVLAGPSVTNTGTITANGGRVGLVAANSVSVDVEGDGLVFFEANATEAKNRLQQLGRIQADGGTVEMRAEARGAFADTVLNMAGVVQARSLGSREGRVVIEGGSDGVVAVAGQVDASGLGVGEHGGQVTVDGQRVLLDNGSVVDASGSAGGGSISIGGGFHGADPGVRNSQVTGIAAGAMVRADATGAGDGGKVAIWSDGATRFYGKVSAEGGKTAGDGGFVEVSGKQELAFRGDVSTLAPNGKRGTLLLDPKDISIIDAAAGATDDNQLDLDMPNAGDPAGVVNAGDDAGTNYTLSSKKLENISGSNDIVLQASNSITIADLVTHVTTTHMLTLGQGASFSTGAGGFSVGGTTAINAAGGPLTITSTGAVQTNALQSTGAITVTGSAVTFDGAVTSTGTGKAISVTGPITLGAGGGTISVAGNSASNSVTLGPVDGAQALNITAAGGAIALGTVGPTVTSVTLTAGTANLGPVTTTHAQDYSGVTTTTLNGALAVSTAGFGVRAGAVTLAPGGGAVTLTGSNAANDVTLGNVDGAGTLAITANGGDVVLGTVGAGTPLTGVAINSATASLQNVKTTSDQTYNSAVSAAAVMLDAGAGSISATNAGNDFTGMLTLKATGPSIAVRDANDLSLAAPVLGNTNLSAIAGGVLTLPGAINTGSGSINLQSQGGALATAGTLTTTGGSVTLVGSAGLSVTDDVASAGGNVSLTGGGPGGLAVSSGKSINAGAGTITVDGGAAAIQLNDSTLTTTSNSASAVTIRHATTVALGNVSASSGTLQLGVGSDITGAITQNASTSLVADTLAASTAVAIDLGTAAPLTINNLGDVQRGGALTIKDSAGGLALTGDITTGATGSDVSITTAGGPLALGTHNITTTGVGNDLTLKGAGVTQTAGGALHVGGATHVDAGLGSIDLQSASNDFSGNVDLTAAGNAAIRTANALSLTTSGVNGITAIAGTTLSVPGGPVTTTGGPIDLEALGGTLATSGPLTSNGGTIKLVGATGLSVADDVASSGGAISLVGGGAGLVVSSGKSINAGAGTITVDGGAAAIQLNDSTLTTTSNSASAVTIRHATTVALGNVSAASGTLQVGVGADINGAITQNGGTSLVADTLAASTAVAIDLGTAAPLTINNLGDVRRGGALTIKDSGGGLALSGDITTGTTSNDVSLTTAGGPLALGTHNITTTAGGNLTLNGVGVTQSSGSLTVGGTTGVNAGLGSIALQSLGNDFSGAVTLATSGSDAAVRDTNNLVLGSLAGLGAATDLTAIAGGALTLPGGPITTAGLLDLRSLGGTLVVNAPLNAASISLTGSAGVTIAGNLVATNAVALTSTNAAISEAAGSTITAGGATTFNAGSGTVTLAQNNTLGSIGGNGGAVSVSEGSANGVALDAINATSLSVTTTSIGAGVTQNGAAHVGGATTITTAGGGVTLANAGNDFGSVGVNAAGAAVSITDGNGLALDTITAATLTVNSSAGNGAITQNAAATVTGATSIAAGSGSVALSRPGNAFGSVGVSGGAVSLVEGSANGVALDAINAASLSLTTTSATGDITQNAAATVSGATAVTTSGGNVALANPGNNFGSVGANAVGANVSIADSNALALDAIAAGTLTVNTSGGNGAISQNAAAVVAGATVVSAGAGSITLNNPGNDFSAGPGNSLSGGAISVRDSNALTLTTLAPGANQSLSVVAGGALVLPLSGIDTGAADLTLSSGATLSTPGALSGRNISLAGTTGVTIGSDVSATGTLSLSTTNAAVNQTAGKIVAAGVTTVTAGNGSVTLAQPLDNFSTLNVASAGNVQIADLGGLGLSATASGALSVGTTGVLASTGAIAATNISLTGNGGISLGNNVVASGTLNLASTNSAITQTGASLSATGGLTTVNAGSGDITLAQAGNDFSNAFGVSATGGAVRLADANALVIAGLANGANKDLSLSAGTTISGVAGNIDTGSADLTINAGNGFTTFGTLRGTNITLGGGTGGLSVGHNVTALGNLTLSATNAAITQTAGAIVANSGTTTANAGTGAVSLAQAGNDFATFSAIGGAVSVVDANGVALGPTTATTLSISSNGAITQSGAAVVTGVASINAGAGAVTLGNAGNDWASIGITGGAVAVTDSNALALNAVTASSLAVNTSAGNGAVTQTAPLVVSGATAVNAGTGSVLLANPGNNFGSFGATGGSVTVNDGNALALDAINATSLTVSVGGALTQNAAAVVSGATTISAGANAVTLDHAGNDFGNVSATAGVLSLHDSNAIALGAISAASLTLDTSAGNGAVTQTGAATVAGATTVDAGTGAVTLTNAGNNFASVAAHGGAVSLKDSNAITLGAINAASLSVDTSTGNGAVTQTAAAIVSGPTTVTTGSGALTLNNAGNDFGMLGVTGGAISVVDVNALTLTSLASGANQAVNISAGGVLSLPASPIDTGTANLSLTSGGDLTSMGTLRGTNVALASGAALTLTSNVTALGTLSLTSANAAIKQTAGAIVAVGATTVNAGSGDVTLAQTSNDFQGPVALTAGAVDVRDTNDLSVASLASAANRPVTLVAGGSLVLPASPIDTGSADLTLQALGGSLVINSALSGNNVTLTGSTGLTLGANITSSGDQIYTTAVQLSGNVVLDAGASRIDLQGGANGGGHDLALTSGNAAANAIRTGAPITNTAQFAVNGNSTLGGNVTTTGNQTYAGPVLLAGDVTLAAGTAKIDLQGAVDAGGHSVGLTSSNASADAIRAESAIGNAAQLTVTGKSTLASGVTTTGGQLYSDTVTLGSSSSFSASSLGFGNGIAAGAFDLGLQADSLSIAGAVTGTGNASVSSTTQGASIGIAGGAGALQISQAELDDFATFASLAVGRTDGTGKITVGNLTLPTQLAIKSGSGDASFTGTVSSAPGQSRNLTVSTAGTTTFSGDVGGVIGGSAALGALSVAGATRLDADATTTGAQSFGGAVTIGADATLSSSATTFAGSLDIGGHAVSLLTDALVVVGGPATGTGAASLRVAPQNATGSIGIAGAAGTLQVSQGLLNTLSGIPTLTLGRADGSGAVTAGNITLASNLAIVGGSGNVVFNGTVDSAAGPGRDLDVTTAGTTSFTGAVGSANPLATLTVAGASQLGGSVVTSGAQTYTGTATLAADSTLTAPSVTFGGSVDGGHALAVDAAATRFGGAVGSAAALTTLTTDAAGTTQLGGNVTTSGAQTYNDTLVLDADAQLRASTLRLSGKVDGAHSLSLIGSGGVSLEQVIGAATPLTSLSVNGPLQFNAGAVTTTGSQAYTGPVMLGASTSLSASSISFGSSLDGPFALALQSAGTTSFASAVGASAPLLALAASGGGTVVLDGASIETSGAQSYSGALQLAGNTRLTGSSLTLSGPVSGAADLTLQTNALSGGTSINGTGTLTIAPVDATASIGVAGGPGILQISQALLDGASGFTSHVIGRSDGSGALSAGNLVLRADTTLQTASGDIDLGGSVDGAFALALNSGATTRIGGPVGTATALKSLTTDNNAASPDWNGTSGERTTFDTADGTGSARVTTTGPQTYNDPLTASVPIVFSGSAITASQAPNRFDASVSANADSLQLHSSSDLTLGTITLANGGAVDTDGVLHLGGVLQLNGGTLVLTANATPTPIDFTDPDLQGKPLTFGFVPIKEASATIVEDAGATLGSALGSTIAFRSPKGGSLQLDQPGNTLLGSISAVSGKLDDNDLSRFNNASVLTLGFIRIASSEIHVAGAPPGSGDQSVVQAGLEGDVIKLTADTLTTGTDGLIRARLPFNNVQGSQTSIPGVTFVLSPAALAKGGSFGGSTPDSSIRIQVGGAEGGFITAAPKGVGGENAVIFLGGSADVRPFYDQNGKLTEIRVFYNGDAPRTPQEAGALAAVIALIEEARHARFEEAVRTENVSSRLRSGVIAEVGAGRPATVGRESIKLPETCDVKTGTLRCE